MSELHSLLELLGEDATLKIMEAHAGTRLGVPKEIPAQHHLKELLGDSGFALLFQYFGGSEIVVPIARRWRIKAYLSRGLTPKKIARLCGCSEDRVYAIKRGDKHNIPQLSLNL